MNFRVETCEKNYLKPYKLNLSTNITRISSELKYINY